MRETNDLEYLDFQKIRHCFQVAKLLNEAAHIVPSFVTTNLVIAFANNLIQIPCNRITDRITDELLFQSQYKRQWTR